MDSEHLLDETKRMITDTEDLMKATAGDLGEKAVQARSRIGARARAIRSRLTDIEADLEAGARRTARRVDHYAHEHPWETAAVGAAVGAALGALLGVLLSRRD